MSVLLVDGELVADLYSSYGGEGPLPAAGPLLLTLAQWLDNRTALAARTELGIRLRSDEPPELIAEDLDRFSLIALEFPTFRDGRAYSYARLLRERYGFKGQLRAVGDVLRDQLYFMRRAGFNAFEIRDVEPLAAFAASLAVHSVRYQPAVEAAPTAIELRHGSASVPGGRS